MGVRPGVDVYLPGPLPHAATKRSPTAFCVIVSMARGPYGHLFSKETILFAREKRQTPRYTEFVGGIIHCMGFMIPRRLWVAKVLPTTV